MKVRVVSMFFVVAALFFPVISVGQGRTEAPTERKPIDWFHEDANYHSDTLLLKLLQFSAPYPGYYQQTSLDTNGNAFTARVVPNWAVQNSVSAKLNDALLAQIKQMLAQLDVPSTPAVVEPQDNRFHSAFVFYNGHDFVRLNYNGPNPAQIDAILEILKKEFTAATRARIEEISAHQTLMRETYGDWQNRPGITLNSGSLVNGCKGNRALVVVTTGQRKTAANSLVAVSVYHALIVYPLAVMSGSGNGGRWGDDPVQSSVVTWRVPNANGSFSENTAEQKIELLHNALDSTVTIAGKTFQLIDGNMFVVRIGADWQPAVTQLKEVFEEQSTSRTTLDRFKLLFKNDTSIQQLELY